VTDFMYTPPTAGNANRSVIQRLAESANQFPWRFSGEARSWGETSKGAGLFGDLREIVCKLRPHYVVNIKKFSIPWRELPTMRVVAVFAVRNGEGLRLTGTLLAIFLRRVKPVAQHGERLRMDFSERETAAEIGLHIDDFGSRVK
jgi:hypothetical protein